jgi:hypothetical protein
MNLECILGFTHVQAKHLRIRSKEDTKPWMFVYWTFCLDAFPVTNSNFEKEYNGQDT